MTFKLSKKWLGCSVLIPIAKCISDIRKKKANIINSYQKRLNKRFRLLTSTVNYINQLVREVAHIHRHDSALAKLCRWDCKIGKDELFPFDVVKKL